MSEQAKTPPFSVKQETQGMKDFYETNSFDREPTVAEDAKAQAEAEKADAEDE